MTGSGTKKDSVINMSTDFQQFSERVSLSCPRRAAGGESLRVLSRGFSLVELIVVMAIFAILASVAIPGMVKLGLFSRNELENTAREIHALMQTAQVYAVQRHTNAAVVYGLDNWNPDAAAGVAKPIQDSITGEMVRVLQSAALMYRIKNPLDWTSAVIFEPALGTDESLYVPVASDEGGFREFQGEMVVLLVNPGTGLPVYQSELARYTSAGNVNSGPAALGMNVIRAEWNREFDEGSQKEIIRWAWFPAHVFTSDTRLEVGGTSERFEIMVAPIPSVVAEQRFVGLPPARELFDTERAKLFGPSNLVCIPIELFRSSGRIKIVS